MSEANDFLMGGGITPAKFDTIGTTVSGTVTAPPKVEQQKDFTTGEMKFWPDGKPAQQLVVTVQTTLRDPETPDDDGLRTFYVKANMLKAVREAVRKSGTKGLEVGGTLAITYSADGEQNKRGFNPPKLYAATYTAPSAVAANEFLNGNGQQAAPSQQQPAQPYQGAYAGALQQSAQHNQQQAAPLQNPQGSGVGVPAVTTAQQAPAPAAVSSGGVDPAALAAAMANLTPAQREAILGASG